MKRIKIFSMILLGSCLIAATSCKKYLDVNNNPNAPIDATPDLILPAALAQTAANNVVFNSYGAWVGGYQANAGGFGGFGSELTYNYSTANNNGLWSSSFSNLNDYQTIINKSDATGVYKNYNAIAKIMKAYNYLRLIDVYGDVPYSEALKGLGNLTPKYDKAEDIYKDLFVQINEAIASLALPNNPTSTIKSLTSPNSQRIDIFGGYDAAHTTFNDASFESDGYPNAKWTELANTIKLKMLVRIREVASLASTFNAEKAKLASATFITYDVKAQPGYAAQGGKQNPAWNAYAYDANGTASQKITIPTFYSLGYYKGEKIFDRVRGAGITVSSYTAKIFNGSTVTAANQLGITDAFVPASPNGTFWYVGSASGTSGDALGILKGPTASMPIFLATESYFLQAEAALYGIIPGSDETYFYKGIESSFRYLYTKQNEAISTDHVPGISAGSDVDFYRTDDDDSANSPIGNQYNYLVNYGLPNPNTPALVLNRNDTYNTNSTQRKLEAIITQKWIALTYIQSNEGWSDYRRTGYPVTGNQYAPAGSNVDPKYYNFASVQSVSTRPDKLPVRVLYPASEYALNPANAPAGINAFTSRVFYDLN
ncbi:SusD/RagB family nutrient-binding outer membrane lipoprotein [Mucilaginibacter lutimaris]|uniref:SusD/RagB family nutrient-binding outer membrane lipoprotein n=1 Tax=Mucilaginibacter lutimaris TaxID=931629 RepID=A0ABW2ZK78_9SPHI